MAKAEPELRWDRVSRLVADWIGLNFPADRYRELKRGFSGAAGELGFADAAECAQHLLGGSPTDAQLAAIATHLTIGETYFLREHETFGALADRVLPALIDARRRGDKRLRLWSAACCSGEEAYSLAIVLHRILPDIADWQIDILATDINPRFLGRAATGVYGEWSFRGAPASFRQRYFQPTQDGRHAIAPEIKRMVGFARLNLVQDVFPSQVTGPEPFDLILCRNVLMYFTPEQAERAVGNLHRALRDDGWLVVAPCELSATLFSDFTSVRFDDAIFYTRDSAPSVGRLAHRPLPLPALSAQQCSGPTFIDGARPKREPGSEPRHEELLTRAAPQAGDPVPKARAWSEQGRHDLVVDYLLKIFGSQAADTAGASLLAGALANQGRLSEALQWCERWIACDKLDAGAHYLQAMVLIERGELIAARAALRRSLYLEPQAPMISFALGSLERRLGRQAAAGLHFRNTLDLLAQQPVDRPLEYAEGIGCGQLRMLVHDALDRTQGDA